MRIWSAPILLLAFLVVPAAMAASVPKSITFDGDNIVVPPASPVHFAKIQNGPDKTALFQGRFLLTGTYYYGDNDFNDSGDAHPSDYVFQPQAYIIPDDVVAMQLPRFAHRNNKQRIFIANPVAFSNAAISKAMRSHVRCRNCDNVTGHVAIWVDQFRAGIACDSPYYEVRFLSVDKPALLALVPKPDRAC